MISNNLQNANRYNLYNFEHGFREFLLAGNGSRDTIKNYLSDFRHFSGFAMRQTIATPLDVQLASDKASEIAYFFTSKLVQDYKSYLLDSDIPRQTINRRLSTVRKFASYCLSQGWIQENPSKNLINVSSPSVIANGEKQSREIATSQTPRNDNEGKPSINSALLYSLHEYENTLGEKMNEKIVEREISNVKEFFSILSQ